MAFASFVLTALSLGVVPVLYLDCASLPLTSCAFLGTIAAMPRNGAAALVIVGWLTLSCYDIAEDLNQLAGQTTISTSTAKHGSAKPGAAGGPLANNIVESANRTPRDITITSIMEFTRSGGAGSAFRRHSPLHKLHRVFLI